MIIFESPVSLALLCTLILLHVVTAIFNGKISKILGYVNIALHIIMILTLLYDGVPIDEAALLYMISVFVYTLARLLRSKIGGGEV